MVGPYTSIWNEMRRMQEEMDALFERLSGGWSGFGLQPGFRQRLLAPAPATPSRSAFPSREPVVDLMDAGERFVATVELPGVRKEDIQLEVSGNTLTLSIAKRHEAKEQDPKTGAYRLEQAFAGYRRTFTLPEHVDTDKLEATYRNGVLEITIPKKDQQASSARAIPVK